MEIYLDNAATTRVCPEAAEAAANAMLSAYGNPSSTHGKGREAKKLLDAARRSVASALGCAPGELVFTSCGSESDNWALLSGAWAASARGGHVISSAVEHDAVLKTLDELERRGYEVTRLSPGADGAISVDAVRSALRPDTVLVSLMMVNNETGAVTDVAAVARMLIVHHQYTMPPGGWQCVPPGLSLGMGGAFPPRPQPVHGLGLQAGDIAPLLM